MSAAYLHPPRDADVAQIAAALPTSPGTLPETLVRCRSRPEQGAMLRESPGIVPEECAALYCLASDLCDVGDFHQALPVALRLTRRNPHESRYAYLAGTCLQRLGQHENAAAMYALACDADPDDAAAAFQLGVCLAALGRSEQARDFLNRSIDLSHRSCDRRRLQNMASACLAAVDKAAPPCPGPSSSLRNGTSHAAGKV